MWLACKVSKRMVSTVALLFVATLVPTALTQETGDTICVEGYVMDTWCIEETGDPGVLLDNPVVVTLEEPELHSVHCLIDVSVCADSVFTILNDKEPGADMHTVGYTVDDESKANLIATAEEVGVCDTCTGTGTLEFGFRIGGMATVLDADVDPPLISITSFEPVTVDDSFCAGSPTSAAAEEDVDDGETEDVAEEPSTATATEASRAPEHGATAMMLPMTVAAVAVLAL